MAASLDGPVSRYLNRRASVPIASLLRATPVTPNQVSVIALAMAFGVAALLAAGRNVEAGVVIQVSSIVDGVDGDLARAKHMASSFGGVLDAALDRYADAAMGAGMAWYAFERQGHDYALLVGFAAIVSFLMISYSRARLETEGGRDVASDLLGFASRDVRLLVLAIGTIAGEPYWTLVLVAVVSYATVSWRLASFWRQSKG